MGKTAAIIAELNPLHSGHQWFFEKVRELSGADYLLVIMSGDFVQRGTPAIFDKYIRTDMALSAGADAVIELPAAGATGSAGRFAACAVSVLQAAGITGELWFGSEAGRIDPFLQAADILADEPDLFHLEMQRSMKEGMTWPAARSAALAALCPSLRAEDLFSAPNNILGLEYCLALRRAGSRIVPRTIRRAGEPHDASLPYHATADLRAGTTVFASSSSLRQILEETGRYDALRGNMPEESLAILAKAGKSAVPITEDHFSWMLLYQLMKETPESLTDYLDISRDLAQRIHKELPRFRSFRQFADVLKTRNTTRTQINRALLHILLGITPEDFDSAIHPHGLRLLGFREGSSSLLTEIKANGTAPLLAGNDALRELYAPRDLFASDLYEAVRSRAADDPFTEEFRHPVIRR